MDLEMGDDTGPDICNLENMITDSEAPAYFFISNDFTKMMNLWDIKNP